MTRAGDVLWMLGAPMGMWRCIGCGRLLLKASSRPWERSKPWGGQEVGHG